MPGSPTAAPARIVADARPDAVCLVPAAQRLAGRPPQRVHRRQDGDLFPTNLRNRPFFVVNGGRDPLYPTSTVEPYLEHLRDGGVTMVYHPQPEAGHDTSWWPQEKDAFEAFVREHPRAPLPDRLTWESSSTQAGGRAHWVVIESLGPRPGRGAAPA